MVAYVCVRRVMEKRTTVCIRVRNIPHSLHTTHSSLRYSAFPFPALLQRHSPYSHITRTQWLTCRTRAVLRRCLSSAWSGYERKGTERAQPDAISLLAIVSRTSDIDSEPPSNVLSTPGPWRMSRESSSSEINGVGSPDDSCEHPYRCFRHSS